MKYKDREVIEVKSKGSCNQNQKTECIFFNKKKGDCDFKKRKSFEEENELENYSCAKGSNELVCINYRVKKKENEGN